MKVQLMQPNSESVLVTESTLPQGIIFKNKKLLNDINCWHKFIVHNSDNSSRNEVLQAVLDQVHPLDLIPVSYWKDRNGSNFLARNCGPAIQKLCKENLVVPAPNKTIPYKLSIILKFATTGEFKIDVQKNILKVLTKRYDVATKTLNLSNFYEDQDLSEFCALSQPKIMFFVLHLSKSLTPQPENYIMSNNRIKLLNPLESISKTTIPIKSLDLRNNLLDSFERLGELKLFKLKDLFLDGNPLCDTATADNYVLGVTKIAKGLETLDGLPIRIGCFPVSKKIYLCNIDGKDLVDQFLDHYFYIYDSQNRRLIQELYHKNAMFSINSLYHNAQISSANTKLYRYGNVSRNLHKLADVSLTLKNLFRGNMEITNILTSLPPTEHDPYSFVVDLIYYTPRCAIIGISGVFRERPESLLEVEQLYGFRRIFTIETLNSSGLCFITNEEYHICNAMSWQVLNSFKVAKPDIGQKLSLTFPRTEKDQQKVIEALKVISTLNTEWSKKCLEECNYDLKKALLLFVNYYKQNRIPDEAFVGAKQRN